MKKLSTVLCLSAALMASNAVQAQWEYNWLVGVTGGWAEREGTVYLNAAELNANLQVIDEVALSTKLKHSGWVWGLLGGYQARCNGWLVGLELNVDWANRHQSNNFQYSTDATDSYAANADYKRDTNVGLSVRLGHQIAQYFLAYLRAGAETSRDRLTVSAVNTTAAVTDSFTISESRRVYRGVFGIGAEIPVPMVEGLSARAEYDYHTKGRNVHAQGLDVNTTGGIVAAVSADTKQHANSGTLALVWNFM